MTFAIGDRVILDKADSRFHQVTGSIASFGEKYDGKITYFIAWDNKAYDGGRWSGRYLRPIDEPVIEEDWS